LTSDFDDKDYSTAPEDATSEGFNQADQATNKLWE